jgi:hypothetical protein
MAARSAADGATLHVLHVGLGVFSHVNCHVQPDVPEFVAPGWTRTGVRLGTARERRAKLLSADEVRVAVEASADRFAPSTTATADTAHPSNAEQLRPSHGRKRQQVKRVCAGAHACVKAKSARAGRRAGGWGWGSVLRGACRGGHAAAASSRSLYLACDSAPVSSTDAAFSATCAREMGRLLCLAPTHMGSQGGSSKCAKQSRAVGAISCRQIATSSGRASPALRSQSCAKNDRF